MSITDTATVDALGIDRVTGEAVLTISDHLPWDDQGAHLSALEDKINAYLSFVEGGQLAENLPDATDSPIKILLVHQYQPSEQAARVLEKLRSDLSKSGLTFEYRGLPNMD